MRSIGARITLWYALGATVSFAVLSLVGGALLRNRMIDSLDALNAAEFRQLKAQIGADFATVDPADLTRRLRRIDQYQSVLFYIVIDAPLRRATIYRSHNLRGAEIPDRKGARSYGVSTPELGLLRVGEFPLPPYDVKIATSALAVEKSERAYLAIAGGLVVVMLMLSVAIGRTFSRFVLRPIRAIRATAERIGSDNLRDRIPVADAWDEIDGLAILLNSMFDRLEAAFMQMQRFSEEVSHELKTPLALVRLHAETVLRDRPSRAHADAALEQIEEIDRLVNFIDQMLFLSRADVDAISFALETIDPAAFVADFAHDAEALAEHKGRRFMLVSQGRGEVAVEPGWLRQVLFNVVSNALRATPEGGLVELRSGFADGVWRLTVDDEGPGLPLADCERIFDRFVQVGAARGPDRGSGLGLAIARGIVKLHRGTIVARPRDDRSGLRVTVELPAAVASPAAVPNREHGAALSQH